MTYWILGLLIFWGIVFILNNTIVHKQDRSITPKQWQDMQAEWKREDAEKKFEDDIFDTLIEYQIEEHSKMNSEITLGSKVFPAQIISLKAFPYAPLVFPNYDKDGTWKVDEGGRPLGYIRVEQKIQKLIEGHISFENRVAFINGPVDALVSFVRSNKLKDGSTLSGKIIIKESLEPKWEGHNPVTDNDGKQKGFSFSNKFYPLYRQYLYTEDINDCDEFVTEEQARDYFNSNLRIVDDLPF